MKKALSIILSLCILFSLSAGLDLTAFAKTTKTEGGFVYSVNNYGEAEITKYTGSATSLTIPSKIGGYPVTSAGIIDYNDYDYKFNDTITSITISKGIKNINYNAFYNCKRLTSVSIPNSVTTISDSTFRGCSSLKSIDIPNSVTEIGWDAFRDCSNLKSINIPNSVEYIRGGTFAKCTSLTNIAIPPNIERIQVKAFYGCISLKSITIPNSVKSIFHDAFYNCKNLKSIVLPYSLNRIEEGVFFNCNNLKNIVYTGSKKDWKKIKIAEHNDPLKKARFTYLNLSSALETKETEAGKKRFNLSWKKVKGVTGYEIQYATNKKFKKAKTKTVKAKKTSLTVKKLRSRKKYFIRIRAYKKYNGNKYYSDWSKAKSIKTK